MLTLLLYLLQKCWILFENLSLLLHYAFLNNDRNLPLLLIISSLLHFPNFLKHVRYRIAWFFGQEVRHYFAQNRLDLGFEVPDLLVLRLGILLANQNALLLGDRHVDCEVAFEVPTILYGPRSCLNILILHLFRILTRLRHYRRQILQAIRPKSIIIELLYSLNRLILGWFISWFLWEMAVDIGIKALLIQSGDINQLILAYILIDIFRIVHYLN